MIKLNLFSVITVFLGIPFFAFSQQQNRPWNDNYFSSMPVSRDITQTGQTYGLPADFPAMTIKTKNKPTGGYYFLNKLPLTPASSSYLMIIDTNAFPIYYRLLTNRGNNLTLQKNGYLTYFSAVTTSFQEIDSAYQFRRQYHATDGYQIDGHELRVMANGNYWVLAGDPRYVDMSQIVSGGNPHALVIGFVIQGLSSNGIPFFQWSTWDHFQIIDCDTNFVDLTAAKIDYVHPNALDFDYDGNLLLSSRHLDEITKININTGDVMWRWGGKNNEFTFTNDSLGFYGQHMIRYNADQNTYTLFDNGNRHTPPHTRALEYQLNQNTKTATLLHELNAGDSLIFSPAMGGVQRLPDGSTVVGWSINNQAHILTEYNPDGEKSFELMTPDTNFVSYRAYKYPWKTSVFSFDSDSLSFDNNIKVGDSSILEINVTNHSLNDINLTGFNATTPEFYVNENFPTILHAGESKQFYIMFKPLADKYYTDVISLLSDTDSSRIACQMRVFGVGVLTSVSHRKQSLSRFLATPNPAKNQTTITLQNDGNIQKIEVYQLTGQMVFEKKLTANIHKYQLDISGFPAGIYFVVVNNGYEISTLKLLIQ